MFYFSRNIFDWVVKHNKKMLKSYKIMEGHVVLASHTTKVDATRITNTQNKSFQKSFVFFSILSGQGMS